VLTEPIDDKTWKAHMQYGEKLEDFELAGYRMVFLRIRKQSFLIHYHLRLIVFPSGKSEPVLSLNLESNFASPQYFLCADMKNMHANLGHADKDILEEDFKTWAIERAKEFLQVTSEQKVPQKDILKQKPKLKLVKKNLTEPISGKR